MRYVKSQNLRYVQSQLQKYNITAIILAGGKSSRMGFNKEELELNGERLIFKQIELLEPIFKEIIVISPNKHLYKDKNVKVYKDILDSKGPLTGLHSGLTYSNTDYNFVIACDMPHIDQAFIFRQIEKLDNLDAYIIKNKEFYEPFHGFYNKRLVNNIEDYLRKDQSFQRFIDTISKDVSTYEQSIFTNINTPDDLHLTTTQNKNYQSFEIEKHNDASVKNTVDNIINEFPITLYLNNEKYVTLLITPNHIKQLIIGYLRSEKIIETLDDIKDITIDTNNNKAFVNLTKELDLSTHNKDLLLTSGCGVGTKFHEDLDQVITDSVSSNFTISKEDIYNASKTLNNRSGLFKLTGGVHSALFIYCKEEIYVEDIGRHNAIDKVVGYITIDNIETKNSYIFASGRISSDMLIKCAVSNIPIVISRSAPTSLAVNLANKYGITLIGFARGQKFNVYTHSFRIKR